MPSLVRTALFLAVTLTSATAGASATALTPRWSPCAAHPRDVRQLQVSHLTCARAVRAIRRGQFALTPGGPVFKTRGFHCSSPVGPPVTEAPRFTVCRRRARAFRFYSFAEPR